MSDKLMLHIMHELAATLGGNAVLGGGMALRLFKSSRATTDLDYIFVPYKSKKVATPEAEKVLLGMKGVTLTTKYTSKMAAITVQRGSERVTVEIAVAESCETALTSTAPLALALGEGAHIISVVAFDVALARKLAAWNERRLIRDLYDAYFMHRSLRAEPDIPTLQKRLDRIDARVPGVPKKMNLLQFSEVLREAADALTEPRVKKELRGLIAAKELPGLALNIRSELLSICDGLSRS